MPFSCTSLGKKGIRKALAAMLQVAGGRIVHGLVMKIFA
jgi:hypothetical protein